MLSGTTGETKRPHITEKKRPMTLYAKTTDELAQFVLDSLDLGGDLGEGKPKTFEDLADSIRSGWISGDTVLDMIRTAITLDRELPSHTEVFVIQSEDGDVIDVTTSREWAEWQTRDDEDNPIRTLHEDTLWDGPEDRTEWDA